MRFSFTRKTPPRLGINSSREGTITVVTALLSLVFTTLALSMIYMSQIHLKISGAKKHIHILEFAAENGIKEGFDRFVQLLRSRPSPQPVSETEKESFCRLCLNGETGMLERFLNSPVPLHFQWRWEQMGWSGLTGFQAGLFVEADGYFQADFDFKVASSGQVLPSPRKKHKSLHGSVAFFCGHLPLAVFPFALDRDPVPENTEEYLEEHGVSLSPTRKSSLIRPYFSGDPLIPDMPEKAVNEAFKTDIFRPQDLTSRRLRTILGLEESDEPVPEGVYLIQDHLGLGGVFVQGDVREMILAIANGFQAVHFTLDAGTWLLKYNPAESTTQFVTPEKEFFYPLIPKGIIIINGSVQSLGGGAENTTGGYELIRDREIPCVLNSVRLTIISTEEVVISSHLLQEGVEWRDGMPYVKDGKAQLNIYAAGCGLGGEGGGEGRITISKDVPQDIKIQASLTAAGEGLSIQGEDTNVTLLGGLHTTDIINPAGRLDILADDRFLQHPELLNESARSLRPLLHCAALSIKEWNEHE